MNYKTPNTTTAPNVSATLHFVWHLTVNTPEWNFRASALLYVLSQWADVILKRLNCILNIYRPPFVLDPPTTRSKAMFDDDAALPLTRGCVARSWSGRK